MRLTHFVKVDARDRASIEASIHFSQHPDEIPIRISQFGAGEPIWMTWAEFDAVADLVGAHRPRGEAAVAASQEPQVTYAICGHRARWGVCVLAKGAHPRHINALGVDVEDGAAV